MTQKSTVPTLDEGLSLQYRGQLKCDGTRGEPRFRLSAKRTSPFKSAVGGQFSRLLAAEVCASTVVMLDTPCSEVVWRVQATHSIHQVTLHFPYRASPCAITFQMESTSFVFRPLSKLTWRSANKWRNQKQKSRRNVCTCNTNKTWPLTHWKCTDVIL